MVCRAEEPMPLHLVRPSTVQPHSIRPVIPHPSIGFTYVGVLSYGTLSMSPNGSGNTSRLMSVA